MAQSPLAIMRYETPLPLDWSVVSCVIWTIPLHEKLDGNYTAQILFNIASLWSPVYTLLATHIST